MARSTQMAGRVERRVLALRDPARAAVTQRFFRTGPGEYGEGDRMVGLTVPQVRVLAKEFRDVALDDIEALLESPWHEARLLALVILTLQYARGDAQDRERIYRLYLRRTDRINNWDLVDVSAPQIVGAHLLGNGTTTPLVTLAASRSLWERRIAIVATFAFIRGGRPRVALDIARRLLDDEHDLIHKATGWMLRDVGKRDAAMLHAFLDRHAAGMPRTALRYAIERFAPAERRRYMAIPRRTRTKRRANRSS